MSIDSISAGMRSFEPLNPVKSIREPQNTEGIKTPNAKSFKEVFSDAIKEVDVMQKDANQSISDLMLGKGQVTPHDAMIALEKADTAFQLMNNIRAKIIRAYEEVIRTQV